MTTEEEIKAAIEQFNQATETQAAALTRIYQLMHCNRQFHRFIQAGNSSRWNTFDLPLGLVESRLMAEFRIQPITDYALGSERETPVPPGK